MGDSRLGRALLELLGRHRGDACLLRRGGRAWRDTGHRHDGRKARRAGARRRRARDRPAVRPSAARGGRLHDRLRSRGRRLRRRCGAHAHRDRRLCRSRRGAGARVGPFGGRATASRGRSPSRPRTPACASTAPGPTAAAAYRWKCQINENSKLPAFAAELPEADHNEIVGWEGAASAGKFVAVFLEDSDQHPRTRQPDRADARADRAAGGRHAARREPRRQPARAPDVARPARRPGLDLPRGAARSGPASRSTVIDRLKEALAKEADQRSRKRCIYFDALLAGRICRI